MGVYRIASGPLLCGVSNSKRSPSSPGPAAGCAAQDPGFHIPIGVIWRRDASHNVIVTGQSIDDQHRGIDPKYFGPTVDGSREVLHTFAGSSRNGRIGATVTSDDRDVVVAVGAGDVGLHGRHYGQRVDVVITDTAVAGHAEAALVVLWSGFGDDRPAARDQIDRVTRRAADRITTIDEDRDIRIGGDVERVVAFGAEHFALLRYSHWQT